MYTPPVELTAKSRMLKPRPSSPLSSSTSAVSASHSVEPGTGEMTDGVESYSCRESAGLVGEEDSSV